MMLQRSAILWFFREERKFKQAEGECALPGHDLPAERLRAWEPAAVGVFMQACKGNEHRRLWAGWKGYLKTGAASLPRYRRRSFAWRRPSWGIWRVRRRAAFDGSAEDGL